MAADEFFGCLLTSFGIPIVMIMFTIIFYPLRIITLIISASFWLVALLLSSVLWFSIVPLRDKLAFGVVFSVLFQEILRFVFIIFLHKIYRGVKLIMSDLKDDSIITVPTNTVSVNCDNDNIVQYNNNSDNDNNGNDDTVNPLIIKTNVDDIFNVTMFAYVGGVGFGVMAGLFATLTMLVDLWGPGTLGYSALTAGDSFINYYAAQTLCITVSHVCYTVVMSRSYQTKSYIKMAVIVAVHMLHSCLTLINEAAESVRGPQAVVAVNCLLTVLCCCWAFCEAGGRWTRVCWAGRLSLRRCMRNTRSKLFLISPNIQQQQQQQL